MAEFTIRVAQRLGRPRERVEERLQITEAAGVRVGLRTSEPVPNVHDQNESVARTLMGIMFKLCFTGV